MQIKRLGTAGLIAAALAITSPAALAGNKYAQCPSELFKLQAALTTTYFKALSTACKKNSDAAEKIYVKTYNKAVNRFNKKGAKLFAAGRCDVDLGLTAMSFNFALLPDNAADGVFDGVLELCNGVDD